MFNLMKKYPELLELSGSEQDNWASLSRVFKRDIQDNPDFVFRGDRIYPIKCEGLMDLERLFTHLTHRADHFVDAAGRDYEKRVYDARRSERLHWIRHHVEEKSPDCLEVFTVTERDTAKHRDVTKTYLYDAGEHYVIVLEHQRKGGYYLLTAFYLSEKYAEKQLEKKRKKSRQQGFGLETP